MFVLLFIVAIVGAIMLHEFGHFVTAKLFGMKATRFFVGFGPTIWSTQRGETEYGVKAIPAGGFVTIVGMTPWEEVDPADDGRLFYQQKPWKRFVVLSAGSATHLLLAVVFLFAALAFVGLPGAPSNQAAAISASSPAATAGLQAGDRIIAIDGIATADFDEVREIIERSFGETVALRVQRGTEVLTLQATLDAPHPDPDRQGAGFLGVSPTRPDVPLGLVDGARATVSGDLSIWRMTSLTVDGLLSVFSFDGLSSFFSSVGEEGPRDPESITSLVGVGQAVDELGDQGDLFGVLAVFAQLNVVLGILNMLPLPPLDGGHVAVMAVEETVNRTRRLRGGEPERHRAPFRLNPAVITPVALVVIMFFVVLSVTAIYVDITNPASQLVQ